MDPLLERKKRDCDAFIIYLKESKNFNINPSSESVLDALSRVWSSTK